MISNSFSAKSGLLDSNQRPRAPQTCALPTALHPEFACKDNHQSRHNQILWQGYLKIIANISFCKGERKSRADDAKSDLSCPMLLYDLGQIGM